MQKKIEQGIDGLQLISERDELKRKEGKQIPFDRVVAAYYSFLTKSAMNRRENIVVDQLNEAEILNSDEEKLNSTFTTFVKYLSYYILFDEQVFQLYSDFQGTTMLRLYC